MIDLAYGNVIEWGLILDYVTTSFEVYICGASKPVVSLYLILRNSIIFSYSSIFCIYFKFGPNDLFIYKNYLLIKYLLEMNE